MTRTIAFGPRQVVLALAVITLAAAAFAWWLRPHVLLVSTYEACQQRGGAWDPATGACTPPTAP